MTCEPDRSHEVLEALARLGRWTRGRSLEPGLFPPEELLRAVRTAFRRARLGASAAADILRGAASFSRALLDGVLEDLEPLDACGRRRRP